MAKRGAGGGSARSGVPQADLDAVTRFCAERSPDDMQEHCRFEVEVDGIALTIVERRPPWDGGPVDWTATNVARLRCVGSMWTLYESTAEGRWHKCLGLEPSGDIEVLLAEIADDPTGIFFG